MTPGIWSLTPGRGGTGGRWRLGAGRKERTIPRSEDKRVSCSLTYSLSTYSGEAPGRASWGSGHDGLPAAGVTTSGH